MTETPKKVYNLLSKKYNILDTISFLDFDFDFKQLETRLLKLKKEKFDVNDRIIIEHQDTDYYIEYCSVGINLLNFFNVVNSIDIPKYVFLIYTNHFGIEKEINLICKNKNDRPTVIESFISSVHYSEHEYNEIDLAVDQIEYQASCMMNLKRSHRHALYNHIRDINPESLMMKVNVNNQ
jgi:hypothetical protein